MPKLTKKAIRSGRTNPNYRKFSLLKKLKTKITDIIQPTLKAYRVNFTFYLPFLQMEKHPFLNILEDLLELVLPEFYILAEQTMHSL